MGQREGEGESAREGEMRTRAILGAGLVAVGIAAGEPVVSAAATVKELQQQAKAHLAKRQPDRAKPILETILNTAQDLGAIRDAARYLAMIAIEQRTFEAFLAQADAELSQNPSSQAARWRVIEGYALSKKPEAVGRLKALFDQMPRSEMLRVRLAQVYAGNGQAGQALSLLEEGLKTKPDSRAFNEAIAQIRTSAAESP